MGSPQKTKLNKTLSRIKKVKKKQFRPHEVQEAQSVVQHASKLPGAEWLPIGRQSQEKAKD